MQSADSEHGTEIILETYVVPSSYKPIAFLFKFYCKGENSLFHPDNSTSHVLASE